MANHSTHPHLRSWTHANGRTGAGRGTYLTGQEHGRVHVGASRTSPLDCRRAGVVFDGPIYWQRALSSFLFAFGGALRVDNRLGEIKEEDAGV